ncbi:MAG: zinc ribbon domain-containing protein [Candidatus Omnitrophota bacterium]
MMDQGYFDYQSISEEKEELDFSKLTPCPRCQKPIPHDATICLYCGEEVIPERGSSRLTWVVVLLIIVITVFYLLG